MIKLSLIIRRILYMMKKWNKFVKIKIWSLIKGKMILSGMRKHILRPKIVWGNDKCDKVDFRRIYIFI